METYLIYNMILVMSVFFSAILSFKRQDKIKICFVIFIVLFIPAALRYGVGLDYFNYVEIFNHPEIYQGRIEVGFYAIVKLLTMFGFGYQSLFALCSALTVYYFIKSIDYDSAWVSTLIFVCTLYLSSYCLLRQALAVSIVMYSCKLWVCDKKLKSIIYLLFACSMHYSVLLFIPVLVVSTFIKISTAKALIIMVGVFVFVFVLNGVNIVFNNGFFLNSRYASYVTSSFNKKSEIGSGIGIAIRLLVPISVAFMTNKIIALNSRNNVIVLTTISFFASYLLATQVYIFGRMSDVFTFALVLVGPLLLKAANNKYLKLFFVVIILLYLPVMQATIANNHYADNSNAGSGLGIYPYQTIFEK